MPARPSRSLLSLTLVLAALALSCGGNASKRTQLQHAPDKNSVVVGCGQVSHSLCPDAETRLLLTRGDCEHFLRQKEDAVLGHICLAEFALRDSQSITVLSHQKDADLQQFDLQLERMEHESKAHALKELDIAVWHLTAAIELKPELKTQRLQRLRAFARLGDLGEDPSLACGDIAALAPKASAEDLKALRSVVLDFTNADELEAALLLSGALIEAAPDFAPALADRAQLLLLSGDLHQALAHSSAAHALMPQDATIATTHLQALLLLRDLEQALGFVADLAPSMHLESPLLSAATLAAGVDSPKAIELYPQVEGFGAAKPSSEHWLKLALVQLAESEADLAVLSALLAHAESPTLAQPLLTLSLAYRARARSDLQLAVLRELLAASPDGYSDLDLAQLQLFIVTALIETGAFDEAQALLLEVQRQDALYWYLQGQVHKALGDPQAAWESFERVLELDPEGALAESAQLALEALQVESPERLYDPGDDGSSPEIM